MSNHRPLIDRVRSSATRGRILLMFGVLIAGTLVAFWWASETRQAAGWKVELVANRSQPHVQQVAGVQFPQRPAPKPEWLERAGLPEEFVDYAFEEDFALQAERRRAAGDEIERRLSDFIEQRAYPLTTLPVGGRVAALEQMWSMLPVQAAADLPRWENIGPAPMKNSDLGLQPQDVSGRVSALVIDPRNSEVVYLGAAQGGVWKTTDGGANWTPLTDNQVSLAIGDLALDPNNPDVVYAGTGEPTPGQDNYYGAGLLKSTDGGQSWTRLGAAVFTGKAIAKVIIDPSNSEIIYVATSLSGVAGPQQPARGVFKSTDGGQSWAGLLTCDDCFGASDLVLNPQTPTTLYAAFWSHGVYGSTDGGANWSQIAKIDEQQATTRRVMLAISPSQPQVVYASFHLVIPGQYDGAYLLKTVDSGANWSRVPDGGYNYCGGQCWYSNVIAVHPTQPNTLYLGGMAEYSGQTATDFAIRRVVIRTTDSGATYQDLSPNDSPQRTLHPDMHTIVFDPQNSDSVWVGNDGGVWRSSDGGVTWQNRNTNLATLQFTGISIDPTNAQILHGGMQDNNKAITTDGGASRAWAAADVGDGGFALTDPFNPQIFYGSRFGKSFQRNEQGSANLGEWEFQVSGIDQNDRSLFYAPFAADPATAGVLYYGTYRLYQTTDRGDFWTAISPDLTATANGRISAIAVAPSNPAMIYVGASDGAIQVTTNGGNQWTNVAVPPLPNRFVSRLAVTAANPLVAYAVFNGFNTHTPGQPGHVFKTIDGGASWQDISGDLPDVPTLSLALDRSRAGVIYIGTDTGVFRTENDGQSWLPFNNGLPSVAVVDLIFSGNGQQLIAGTHGRSIWRAVVSESPPPPTPVTGPNHLYLAAVGQSFRSVATPPTPVPTATHTPSPTPTPTVEIGAGTPLPTTSPTATATRLPPTATPTKGTPGAPTPTATGTPTTDDYFDDFSDVNSGWERSASADCDQNYNSGRYRIAVLNGDQICFAAAPAGEHPDGAYQVSATKNSAIDGSVYGLVFGLDDAQNATQFYVYWVDPEGQQYTLQKYDNGVWTFLTVDDSNTPGWVPTTAIRSGAATNVLRVRRQGDNIRLYVNDRLQYWLTDNSFPTNGLVGVANWFGYTTSAAVTRFDDFRINHFTVVFRDDFSRAESGWFTGEIDRCQAEYAQGRYRTATQPDSICVYSSPVGPQANGLFEVEVQRAETFYQTAYGLLFGDDGNFSEFYVFLVIPDTQSYALAKYSDVEGWIALLWDESDDDAWLPSDLINPSTALNRLGAERDGPLIRIYINGEQLDQALDFFPLTGSIYGVINWSSQFDSAIADFDNYQLTTWEPGDVISAAGAPLQPARTLPAPDLLRRPNE